MFATIAIFRSYVYANSRLAESLALKHSRQWLQLAINTQYDRLSKIRGCVFPVNQQEDHDITRLRNSLAKTKEHKLKQLLNRQRRLNREYEAENKPQGFKNLSSETLDNQLIKILEKGPSFVNAEPNDLPKLSLLAKASLQRLTDQLKDLNVCESTLNEFKGGMVRVIEEGKKYGSNILKHKKLH